MHHAHIYFDPDTRAQAIDLRTEIDRRFGAPVGRVHDRAVGPHPKGMFQVLIDESSFAAVVPWLMLNRGGLDILVHAETGDDVADHTSHALWMGSKLPLDLTFLFHAAADA